MGCVCSFEAGLRGTAVALMRTLSLISARISTCTEVVEKSVGLQIGFSHFA